MEPRWATSRTEAFSDGVFAIAITLLVLELGVPEAAFDDLWQGIIDQWPSYLAFATSFLTVGGLWLAHHAIFRPCPSRPGCSHRRSTTPTPSGSRSSSTARTCS